MGHHLDVQGRFQSDKYPEIPPDKIVLSFHDPKARLALQTLASTYSETDPELSRDIYSRLDAIYASDKPKSNES